MLGYILDELVSAGVVEVFLISAPGKEKLESYFQDRSKELGLRWALDHQAEPRGTADAVWQARAWVEDEPFFLYYGDDLWLPDLKSNPLVASTRAQQLLAAYLRLKANWSVLSLMEVGSTEVSRFGVISWDHTDESGRIFAVRSLVEKPKPEDAPSTFALVSGMILKPSIFKTIEVVLHNHSGSAEAYLTSALDLLTREQQVYGCLLSGEWVDVGTLEDYPRAFIRMVRWKYRKA